MTDKRIDEFNPPNLFLNRATMENMLGNDERIKNQVAEKDNYRNNCITAALAVVGPAATVLSSLANITSLIAILNMGLVIVIIFLLIWNVSRYVYTKKLLSKENYNGQSSYTKVLHEVIEHTKYTAVILIALKAEDEPLKFLCRKTDSFLVYCKMDSHKTISEQTDVIKKYLNGTFGFELADIFDVIPLGEEPFFTVKPVYSEIRSNAFMLYTVQLNDRVKDKVDEENYIWRSIDDMKNDPEAMKLNYDIIDKLDSKRDELTGSFQVQNSDLHIIWNITKACGYHCAICATADDTRNELSVDNKLRVLSALYKEKKRIKTLDFAGGDPCCSPESLPIIQAAIDMFGKNIVSVTTTAKGIKSICEGKKQQLLSRCEITIDASHEYLSQPLENSTSRNENQYSKSNADLLPLFSDNVHNLTINIPILDGDLSEEEIAHLVRIILDIRENYPNLELETHLIRLMPVGNYAKNFTKKTYKKYNPIQTAMDIKTQLNNNNITCSYHCSLRTLDVLNNGSGHCSMLEHKIGIDCAGNVFACPWGAYLPNNEINNNPFFLGNLTKQSLNNILNNNSAIAYKRIMNRIKNKQNIHYCEVVSRFFNESSHRNNDPLAQIEQTATSVQENG